VYIWTGAYQDTGSTFLRNYAGEGGAISLQTSRDTLVALVETNFTQNQADTAGGAVYTTDVPVSCYACELYGNRALTGAAFYASGTMATSPIYLLFDGSIFWNNVAGSGA
jgi:predicted outer membrane repeat protein